MDKEKLKKIADDMLYTKGSVERGFITEKYMEAYNRGIMDLADEVGRILEK